MSAAPSNLSPGTIAERPPLVRWGLLVGLLLVELLVLSFAFDAGVLVGETEGWARLIRRLPRVTAIAIAVAFAILLCGGGKLWTDFLASFERHSRMNYQMHRRRHRWRLMLAGHLGLVAAFAAATFVLMEGPVRADLTIAWLALGGGTLALWTLAALPLKLWLQLVWHARRAILFGIPLGVVAWGAGWVSARVGWKYLREATLWTVYQLLSRIYPDAAYDTEKAVVGTPEFAVDMIHACSGYQGVGMISVFLIGYLWHFRRQMRFPQAILLVPIGVALIWLSNALRIVVLIAIGASGWPEIAMGGFHSQAGWLAFNAVALGLVAVTGRMRFFSRDASPPDASAGPDPTAAHLAPFLAMVATSMVTTAISADFNWFSPLRVLAAAVALWWFRSAYRKSDGMNSDVRPRHGGMKAAAASGLSAARGWSALWYPMALGAVGFGIWLGLVPIVPSANDGPWPKLASLPQGLAIAWMTVKTIGFIVFAPVAEELAFRDYLTRRLQAADFKQAPPGRFTWWSFVISSAAFGALHGLCWLPGTLAGMLFALALYRRGRLADAIVAHATTNALLAGYVFTTGNWSLWS